MRFAPTRLIPTAASVAARIAVVSAAALLPVPPATAQQSAPAPSPAPARSPTLAPDADAPSRGQLLYDTYCVQCHTSQIHWRDARAARDWGTLRAQVERWQGQAGQSWPDEDIDAVTRYLSDTIYHYRDPRERG